MNVFEELDNIFKFGYNTENLLAIKTKLDNYLTTCPEEDKARCQREIELVDRRLNTSGQSSDATAARSTSTPI